MTEPETVFVPSESKLCTDPDASPDEIAALWESNPRPGPKLMLGGGRVQLTTTVTPGQLAWIDRQAEAAGRKRSSFLRRIVLDRREDLTRWSEQEPPDTAGRADVWSGPLYASGVRAQQSGDGERVSIYAPRPLAELVRKAAKGLGVSAPLLISRIIDEARGETPEATE